MNNVWESIGSARSTKVTSVELEDQYDCTFVLVMPKTGAANPHGAMLLPRQVSKELGEESAKTLHQKYPESPSVQRRDSHTNNAPPSKAFDLRMRVNPSANPFVKNDPTHMEEPPFTPPRSLVDFVHPVETPPTPCTPRECIENYHFDTVPPPCRPRQGMCHENLPKVTFLPDLL